MGISTSQAKEIMDKFNNSPLQKHVIVTITNKNSGSKATTHFDFHLIRPNLIETAIETLNPFSIVNGLGDAWTAITTGNAYVDFDTSSGVLFDNGIVSPIRFSGKTLTYMESLSVSTPVDWWASLLPHQIDNAINAYINVLYLTGTGALVKVDLVPNFGVLSDYNVTIDNKEMTPADSKYSFTLRLGTLDPKIIEEANTTSVSPNQSSGSLTNNSGSDNSDTNNPSNGGSTNNPSNGGSTNNPSNGGSTNNPSNGGNGTNYGQYYPGNLSNSGSNYQEDASTKDDNMKYWLIGGAVAVGMLAFLMMRRK